MATLSCVLEIQNPEYVPLGQEKRGFLSICNLQRISQLERDLTFYPTSEDLDLYRPLFLKGE